MESRFSPEVTSHRQKGNVHRVFSNQLGGTRIKGVLRGGPQPIEFVGPLARLYEENSKIVPPEIYPEVGTFVRNLIRPLSEKRFDGTSRAIETTVFGLEDLLPLANRVVKAGKRPEGLPAAELVLNLGIGTDGSDLGPTLPAYLELALQRLRAISNMVEKVRLRVFSTAAISAEINGLNVDRVASITAQQRAFLGDYLKAFYPSDLAKKVNLDEVAMNKVELDPDLLLKGLERLRQTVDSSTLADLRKSAKRYAKDADDDTGLIYAYYHTIPFTFGDGGPDECTCSVGSHSEWPFNFARGFYPGNHPDQYRAGIVVAGLTGKTPPYLGRDKFLRQERRITMEAMANLPIETLVQPNIPSPSTRELRYMAACVGGLDRLRQFFGDNQNAFWAQVNR